MDSFFKGKLGEEFVTNLATKTFLSYWCYPNPHDESGNKKEICDLLIIFKKVCIICQVKNYEFKGDHKKYFKKTVESASKQVEGAERKLFHSENDIFIKHPENGLVRFERENYTQTIRLVINLGEGIKYQSIGRLTKTKKEFIHILGKEDFEYLLKELNTISDLVNYLISREKLITKVKNAFLFGKEKDLLGFYLRIKPFFDRFIHSNEDKSLFLDMENSWENFEAERALDENEDLLLEVENLIYDWVKKDLLINEKSTLFAEELMSLDRVERRYFAITFLDFIKQYSNKGYKRIIRRNLILNQIGIVYFYYPSEYKNRKLNQLMLIAAEGYALHLDYQIVNFIVIGINEKEKIEFLHIDFSDSKHKNKEDLEYILSQLGWFQVDTMEYLELALNEKEKNKP